MTDYYVDNELCSLATGTWTFTNGSTAVVADGDGNAVAELTVGDRVYLEDDASGPGENGANWGTIQSITDDDTLVLAANYTGTGGEGNLRYSANTGLSAADAYVAIETALTQGQVIYRPGCIHLRLNAGPPTTPASAWHRRDDGSIWPGDTGLDDPVISVGTYGQLVVGGLGTSGGSHRLFEHLTLRANNTAQMFSMNSTVVTFLDCTIEQQGAGNASGIIDMFGAGYAFRGCLFTHTGTTQPIIAEYGHSSVFENCVFDGGKYVFWEAGQSSFRVVGCHFGLNVNQGTACIGGNYAHPSGEWLGNYFYGATEFSVGDNRPVPQKMLYLFSDGHDGDPDAWYAYNRHDGAVYLVAASGTPAGARSGGAARVFAHKRVNETQNQVWANSRPLIHWPVHKAAGTYDVTLYVQHDNGWAAVLDVEGADATLWFKVRYWTAAGYVTKDSRDEAQATPVKGEWSPLVVSDIVPSAAGKVIIEVHQAKGDGSSFLYYDRVVG